MKRTVSNLDIPRENHTNCLEKGHNTGNDRDIHSSFPSGTNCVYLALVKVSLPTVTEELCQKRFPHQRNFFALLGSSADYNVMINLLSNRFLRFLLKSQNHMG